MNQLPAVIHKIQFYTYSKLLKGMKPIRNNLEIRMKKISVGKVNYEVYEILS